MEHVIVGEDENPLQASYRLLLVHGSECATCLRVNASGENLNLPCAEGQSLFEAYRAARQATAPV